MPKVDINAADHALFASCAAAAGLTVDDWLTEAGRLRTSAVGASRSLEEVWAATLRELTGRVSSTQQRAYLQVSHLSAIVEGVALLVVPDAFTRDVFESRLRPAVVEALSRQVGTPLQIAVKVDDPRVEAGIDTFAGTRVGEPRPTDDVGRFAELIARPEVARQLAEVLAATKP